MPSFKNTYHGAVVLLRVHADLLLFTAALAAALLVAGYLSTL